jgi:predicted GNAT family acetyltransferase
MAWTFSNDVDEYAAAAGRLLESDPERHTISLTVIAGARERDQPLDPPELFAWWTGADGEVSGSASVTPPWPLLVETMPDNAIRPLVEALRSNPDVSVVGVNGPTDLAASFAVVWCAATGQRAVVHDAIRLFRLGEIRPPTIVPPGSARLADEADIPLLIDWFTQFGEEVHGPNVRVEENIRQRITFGSINIWCDERGTPVSIAGHAVPAAGVARVGPVFTPAAQRRRGYAGAITHAVSKQVLDKGLRAVLFTDQANPTSNALYMRLGYLPVTDRLALHFEG